MDALKTIEINEFGFRELLEKTASNSDYNYYVAFESGLGTDLIVFITNAINNIAYSLVDNIGEQVFFKKIEHALSVFAGVPKNRVIRVVMAG